MAASKPNYKECVEGMLECCVCLSTVRDPQTLLTCFHSVCADCLQQLIQKENNPRNGVTCPLCRVFCERDNIKANFFINNLADLHNSHTGRHTCEQCPEDSGPVDASSKCLDCKMKLCERCRKGHLKIKLLQGHRILALTEDSELIVDQLVFCSLHPDKSVELFCEPCQLAICMTCKATEHDGHKSKTVQDILDVIVPEMEKNVELIDQQIQAVIQASTEMDKKTEETKSEFGKCRDQINKMAQDRISKIKSSQKTMIEKIEQNEREEMKKLDGMKVELDRKQTEGENLKRVVRMSLDRARHASLLTQLLQGGLMGKVKAMTEAKAEMININTPTIQANTTEWNAIAKEGILGQLSSITSTMYLRSGVMTQANQGSKYWNVSFSEFFSQDFKKTTSIKLPDRCRRIEIIDENIWAPLQTKNINIYNKTGQHVNTIAIQKPVSVRQAFNGDVFIAGQIGLYILKKESENVPSKISEGTFSDVCSFADKVYALNMSGRKILEYAISQDRSNGKNVWKVSQEFNLDTYQAGNRYLDGIVVSYVENSLVFFISSWSRNIIYQYNVNAQLVKTLTGDLNEVFVCGIDMNGFLLVADVGRNSLKILEPSNSTWHTTKLKGGSYLYDAYQDGDNSFWLVTMNGNTTITKYEI